MKESLSSLDIAASVKELQGIVGGHIDKIYQPSHGHLVLAIRTPGEGKSFLHFVVGKWLYRSEESGEMPTKPPDFAMMLRKRIANARVISVRQQGFDRIAVLSLDKDGVYDLVLEVFGDGNVILVKDGIIVQPLTSHTWKHRDVRARKTFAFPPAIPDPTTVTPAELKQLVSDSSTDLVRTLATKLNMGGRYSEEVCARTGLDKRMAAKDVDEEKAAMILAVIAGLRREIDASNAGSIVLKNETPEDVVPTALRIYEGLAHEDFVSFSAAVESYTKRLPEKVKEESRDNILELDRLKRKMAQQEAAVTKLQDDARESQLMGDFLFAHYTEVSNLLKAAKTAIETGGLENLPGYESYDPRYSLLTAAVGPTKLTLDINGDIESNARRYYEEAKRSRKKLEGVLTALAEAKTEIDKMLRDGVKAESSRGITHESTKRFWFERFRWFISSEGAIVLGGKDAKSNDMLVKKHLSPGDRYAHADMHGAPSIVVKMKEGMTEKTLHEACEFAVATSKAWNAKIGSAAGYWVLPEQVSKTPQSGEYLAKGAFVIRGKRNYSNKLEIKLGVGETEVEGARKIMCAPESAIRTRCQRFVMIRPGDMDKNEVAKKLSNAFEVPIEEIQSILPPGDVQVVEQVGLTIS
jgi:predicted ribosome quality control (RQC) complex YloA/Tae2 family protein